jgi:CheY-like chemotaxis protein
VILLVEDDDLLRESLREYLADFGHDVATAENGREALAWLADHGAPRLILLDLMMPVMNGWEFAHRKAQDPGLASVPLVVFSADAHLDAHAKELGADGSLKKPIDLGELGRVLSAYAGPV